MSIAATNWAMDQKTDGPSAQSVLFVIADRANEHGVCRHADPDTIAQKTRQSRATVFRRLEELERVGIVTRFTRHLDDGRREYEVRLGVTKYVNYQVDKFRNIELYALDDDKCERDPIGVLPFDGSGPQDIEGESQIETQGESQIETGTVAPVRPGESQSCDPQESPSKTPSKEDSPPTPQGGSEPQARDQGVDQGSEGSQRPGPGPWPGAETWHIFEAAYGEPILRQSIARQVWSALTDDERKLAIVAAKGYLAHRRAQKKPPNVLNAHTFLRERDAWPGYAKLAPPETLPPTWIAENSIEHKALRVLFMVTGEAMPQLRFDIEKGQHGYLRKLAVPMDLCGLAVFIDKPIDEWGTVEKTNTMATARPFYAWAERIEKWTGHRPEPQRINTGGEHPFTHNGTTTMIKDFVLGLRVPCLYPPRKDGTLSPDTGPDPPPKESAA